VLVAFSTKLVFEILICSTLSVLLQENVSISAASHSISCSPQLCLKRKSSGMLLASPHGMPCPTNIVFQSTWC
jgi:hypothetical protein